METYNGTCLPQTELYTYDYKIRYNSQQITWCFQNCAYKERANIINPKLSDARPPNMDARQKTNKKMDIPPNEKQPEKQNMKKQMTQTTPCYTFNEIPEE